MLLWPKHTPPWLGMAHNLIVSYAPRRHIEIIRPFPAVPKDTKVSLKRPGGILVLSVPRIIGWSRAWHAVWEASCWRCLLFFLGYSEFCQAASGGSVDAADIALNWVTSLHSCLTDFGDMLVYKWTRQRFRIPEKSSIQVNVCNPDHFNSGWLTKMHVIIAIKHWGRKELI